jgi:ubiquinone biosynthesis protein
VDRDLDIVLRVAASLEQRAAWARDLGVVELAQGFAAALREELDFRFTRNGAAQTAVIMSAEAGFRATLAELGPQLLEPYRGSDSTLRWCSESKSCAIRCKLQQIRTGGACHPDSP